MTAISSKNMIYFHDNVASVFDKDKTPILRFKNTYNNIHRSNNQSKEKRVTELASLKDISA